jgi:hypothetical protein
MTIIGYRYHMIIVRCLFNVWSSTRMLHDSMEMLSRSRILYKYLWKQTKTLLAHSYRQKGEVVLPARVSLKILDHSTRRRKQISILACIRTYLVWFPTYDFTMRIPACNGQEYDYIYMLIKIPNWSVYLGVNVLGHQQGKFLSFGTF